MSVKKRKPLNLSQVDTAKEAEKPSSKQKGEISPLSKRVQTTIYLTEDTRIELKKMAAVQQVKVNDLLLEGLQLLFERNGLPLPSGLKDE